MAKRPFSPPRSLFSTSPMSKSRVSVFDNRMDYLLGKLLGISDVSARSVDFSFDRILNSTTDSDQVYLIDRAMKLGSALLSAGISSLRSRSSQHNSIVWPLPPDLTIKIFSFLNAQSLFNAAATCSMFKNCSMDPLCYSNIDLTTVIPKVDNGVVSTLIHRAGRVLTSLKLGVIPARNTGHCTSSHSISGDIKACADGSRFMWNDKRTRKGKGSSILTRNCLIPLSQGCGTAGALLRRLHLYNIERLDNASLIVSLAACQSLLDLEIVGLRVELQQILLSLSKHCHMLERLFFESPKTGRDDSLRSPTCVDFVTNCPHISFLALRGFKFQDFKARLLVKGLTKLKHLDFSASYSITGSFLRNHGNYIGGNLLEVLILSDCMHLKEVEVSRFFNAVLTGEFELLTYLDISSRGGLGSERCWHNTRNRSSNMNLQQVMRERPGLQVVAEFAPQGSSYEMENSMVEMNSENSSDINMPQLTSTTTTSDDFSISSASSDYSLHIPFYEGVYSYEASSDDFEL